MKVLLVVALILGAALAVPKETHLRNLFTKAVRAPKHGPSGRFINGQVAEPHSIPYQAFLKVYDFVGYSWYCGGSLIKENVVLTSGSCVFIGDRVVVTLGAQTPFKPEDSQVKVTSKDIVLHEDFDITDYGCINDIALIRLPEPVNLTDAIQVAKLPADNSKTYLEETGRLSGWGMNNTSVISRSAELRYIDNKIISNDDCAVDLEDVIPDSQVCWSGDNGYVVTHYGDSGNPLSVDKVQVGVMISHIVKMCSESCPSVFTRVSSYLDWIETNSQA